MSDTFESAEELSSAIEYYAHLTTFLMEDNEPEEILNILIWRNMIEDALSEGVGLSADQVMRLRDADDRLMAARETLVKRYSGAFQTADQEPKERWWWHLPEGPHVRDQTEAA